MHFGFCGPCCIEHLCGLVLYSADLSLCSSCDPCNSTVFNVGGLCSVVLGAIQVMQFCSPCSHITAKPYDFCKFCSYMIAWLKNFKNCTKQQYNFIWFDFQDNASIAVYAAAVFDFMQPMWCSFGV